MRKDRKSTSFGAITDFWRDAKKGGWYLPPRAAVKCGGLSPLLYKSYKDPHPYPNKISVSRAWLYLTNQRGGNLKISDPYVRYTSYNDVCSRMLHSLTGATHMRLENIVFLLSNGFSSSRIISKLEERYGIGSYVYDPGPEFNEVKELLLDSMSVTTGGYVFPLRGMPWSILTRYEGEFQISRWSSWDCEDGFALAMGLKDPDRSESISTFIPLAAQEFSLELQLARGSRFTIPKANIPKQEAKPPDPDTDQHLQYIVSMIEGFSRQVRLALHPEDFDRGYTAAEAMEGGDGYDSDLDLGGMFG